VFHHLDPLTVRASFPDVADVFLSAVAAVRPEQWDQPGLGEWSVRELTGHALRAFQTLERLCDSIGDRPAIASASAYYRAGLGVPGAHGGIAERGREAGAQLVDPVATVRMTIEQALGRLAATPDEHVGETLCGPMRLADYLPTRVVEAGLHTLDLQAATDQPLALPASANGVILGVLADLADMPTVLRALAGRRSLPEGFNLFA
jgi:uncharacterized protein (TIGR03083 family)